MAVPGAPAEVAGPPHARAAAVLDATLVAGRVASDAVRLVAKDLGGRIPRASTRRIPAVRLDEVEGVHPAEPARRPTLGPLAVP